MDEITNEEKRAIITQELRGVNQEIYRLSVSLEARKLVNYTEEENRPIIVGLERIIKLRDVLKQKLEELRG